MVEVARTFRAWRWHGRLVPVPHVAAGLEVDAAAAYLDAGAVVLACKERAVDVVDPSRGRVVPVGLRTDGLWVWQEAASYYLRVWEAPPSPPLVAHMQARSYTPAPLVELAPALKLATRACEYQQAVRTVLQVHRQVFSDGNFIADDGEIVFDSEWFLVPISPRQWAVDGDENLAPNYEAGVFVRRSDRRVGPVGMVTYTGLERVTNPLASFYAFEEGG